MPKLTSQDGFSIAFSSLNTNAIDGLRAELQPAAALIYDWLDGKAYFEIQTSGSTGKPKTIILEQDKIEYSALQTANAFGLMPRDRLLCCLGLHYIAGFMMVMRAIVNDCDLVAAPQVSNPLADISDQIKIDFAAFVPIQMETMLNDPHAVKIMNKMKAILVGGAAISESLEKRLQELEVPVFHTYSMTETYTHVAIRRINGELKAHSYTPMPGVDISLDERGCLVITSFLTNNKPLITNDLAEIQGDGSFILLGRADNVINSGGIKIQLEKIEKICAEVFASLGLKPLFFATGIPDEKLGEKLVLVIEDDRWAKEMINTINNQLSMKLGKYEVPKEMFFVGKIAFTKTGKIDRNGTLLSL